VLLSQVQQHSGQQRQDRRLERGHAQRADDVVQRPRERSLSALHLRQQPLCVLDQDVGLRRQPDSPSGRLEQRHASLPLERRELLRHGRRAVAQRLGDRSHRAAALQLAQQPQTSQIEHPEPPTDRAVPLHVIGATFVMDLHGHPGRC
jgi:hypothetical protein